MSARKSFAETLNTLTANWSKTHRRFGVAAALRCLKGSRDVDRGRFARRAKESSVDVLTFSVSPGLTLAWLGCFEHALDSIEVSRRIILGDASGGLASVDRDSTDDLRTKARTSVEVVPTLNFHHGEKLDSYLQHVCTADRVLISDDDVFWLDAEAWNWAHSTFDDNPDVVIASMLPRTRVSSVLSGKIEAPMGSSCLLVRRSRWLELGLSFQIVEPPSEKGFDWFYDTGDHAHLEILRHGDEVAVAPPEIRSSLATVDAVSTWILKIQKHTPERLARIADHPIRGPKALRTVLLAKGLDRIAQSASTPRRWPELVESTRQVAVEDALRKTLDPGEARRLEVEVETLLQALAPALSGGLEASGS